MIRNYYWSGLVRDGWPEGCGADFVHLAQAIRQIGRSIHAEQWRDDDFDHLNAPTPVRPSLSSCEEEWVGDLTKKMTYRKAFRAFEAGQRSREVAAKILMAAMMGTLKFASRPIYGGSPVPIPAEWWDSKRSLHIFETCTFSPDQPFRERTPFKERHEIFVTGKSLNAFLQRIPGAVLRQVSDENLKQWITEHTATKSQSELIESSKTAFPENIHPSRDRVVEMDHKIREDLGLPSRRPGRPQPAS